LGEVRYGTLVNDEAHDPLTDEDTWQACQREPGKPRVSRGPFLLAGLVRCAACRYSMSGQSYGGTGTTPVMRCYHGKMGCPEPSVITARLLEEFVLEQVERYQEGLLIGRADEDSESLAAVEAFDAAAAEVDAFIADTTARQLMGDETWQEGLRLRVRAREERLPARDSALARLQTREVLKVSVPDLVKAYEDPGGAREDRELARHGLRDLLGGTIRQVFVRRAGRGAPARDRVLIVWSDDLRVLEVPGQHNRRVFEPIRW
jgi:hypothetical protein